MGPISRLVDRHPFELSRSKGVLPLIIAANGPNGATCSLMQTFNSIFILMFVTVDILGYKKQKNGDRGTIVLTAALMEYFLRRSLHTAMRTLRCRIQYTVHTAMVRVGQND